jgi:bifunctional non-homologous end joining protein LigD
MKQPMKECTFAKTDQNDLIAEAIRLGAIRRPIEMDMIPMRAALLPSKPSGQDFSYELKLDGIRCIARKNGTHVLLYNRHGRDITRVYPDLVHEFARLDTLPCVVDGEIVALDERGVPSFQRIAERAHLYRDFDIRLICKRIPVTFVVFDILAVGEYDLRPLPLSARRSFLRRTIPETRSIRVIDVFDGDPTALLAFCRQHHLEGIVAKRSNSPYRSGLVRSDDWYKWKNERHDDFVVVGFTLGEGARARMGAIDVASFDDGKFTYRGKVGSGLDDRAIHMLRARLLPLRTDAPTACGEYHPAPQGRIHVLPEVVVSVKYGGLSERGSLRFPVFRGIRDDVLPEECAIDD